MLLKFAVPIKYYWWKTNSPRTPMFSPLTTICFNTSTIMQSKSTYFCSLSLSLSLPPRSLDVCIYIHVYKNTNMFIYIYINISLSLSIYMCKKHSHTNIVDVKSHVCVCINNFHQKYNCSHWAPMTFHPDFAGTKGTDLLSAFVALILYRQVEL